MGKKLCETSEKKYAEMRKKEETYRFFCKKCSRVANKKKLLCTPKKEKNTPLGY